MKLLSWLIALLFWAITILLAPFALLMLCVELTHNKLTGRRNS